MMRVISNLPLSELEHLRDTSEEFVVTRDADDNYRVSVQVDGIEQAWGLGGSEFDAGIRAILTLCPDYIVDYPEYEQDYDDEENI